MLPSLLPRLGFGRLRPLALQAWTTKAIERNHRHQRMNTWGWLGIVAASLSLVKWSSIPTGPSANEVIAAIRVAQHELILAQGDPLRANHPELKDADALLAIAWSTLGEKDYEKAILATHRAIELTRKLKN
jgi:hypothetical protein